ncbi:hypothetical protein QBC39DRAFT_344967 [Podospora conica]|nr:hypothetical protein QBC39DRAFT_344967 [Schizothecium conicum]
MATTLISTENSPFIATGDNAAPIQSTPVSGAPTEVETEMELLASTNSQTSNAPSLGRASPVVPTTLKAWRPKPGWRPWLTVKDLFAGSRPRIGRFLDQLGNTWAWEFASMMLSLASMTAIVAILVSYNGKAFPKMAGDISLNAFVATLSTLSKSSLIFCWA